MYPITWPAAPPSEHHTLARSLCVCAFAEPQSRADSAWQERLAEARQEGEKRFEAEVEAIEVKMNKVRDALTDKYEAGFQPLLAEAEARHLEYPFPHLHHCWLLLAAAVRCGCNVCVLCMRERECAAALVSALWCFPRSHRAEPGGGTAAHTGGQGGGASCCPR